MTVMVSFLPLHNSIYCYRERWIIFKVLKMVRGQKNGPDTTTTFWQKSKQKPEVPSVLLMAGSIKVAKEEMKQPLWTP